MALEKLTPDSPKIGEFIDLERFRSVHEVWEIEIGNVVPNDNIRIDLFNEVSPCLKQLGFVIKRNNLRPYDMCTRIKSENVANEGFSLSCNKIYKLQDPADQYKQ